MERDRALATQAVVAAELSAAEDRALTAERRLRRVVEEKEELNEQLQAVLASSQRLAAKGATPQKGKGFFGASPRK